MASRRMVLWEGPSQLDGTPLVVLATYDDKPERSSGNAKTGAMVQTFILRADIDPSEALNTGRDTAICGDCPHRSMASGGTGACYVTVWQAPLSTWRAWRLDGVRKDRKRDSLPFDVEAFRGRLVRIGSYGDPAAVPVSVWQSIVSVASATTGYTHQWRTADPAFAEFCMASVDAPKDGPLARRKGYRQFIVRPAGSKKPRGAVVCPASAEAGKRTVCASCLQCGGTGSGRHADITIMAHGSTASRFRSLPLMVTS